MFALRHHPTPQHPWLAAPRCDEFRASGLELELIDAVDQLERAEAAGSPDRPALAAQVRWLQDDLVAIAS